MSSVTVVLLHGNDEVRSSVDGDVLESMDRRASSMLLELEDNAHALAVDASGSEEPSDEFDREWHQYLNRTFPRWEGPHVVAMELEDVALMPLEASDINDRPVTLFLVLRGTLWINVSCGASKVVRSGDVERPVFLPSPLVDVSAVAMASSMKGDDDRLTSSLSYQLATLAQARVLQGYGSESLMGPYGTRKVLVEADVMVALEQSLALLGLQEFGAVPDTGASTVGMPDAEGGEVDPARALLEAMNMGPMRVSTLLSMAIQASLDQLVIRAMEHYHMDVLLGLIEAGVDMLIDLGFGYVDAMLGTELLWDDFVNRVQREFAEWGMHQGDYRWWNGGGPNLVYEIEPIAIEITDADGAPLTLTVGGPVELNLTTADIMRRDAWGNVPSGLLKDAISVMGVINAFLHDLSTAIGSCDSLGTVTMDGGGNAFASMREQLERKLEEGGATIEAEVEDCVSDGVLVMEGDAYVYSYVESHADLLLENGPVMDAALADIVQQLLVSDRSWEGLLDPNEASAQLRCQLEANHWLEAAGPVEQRLMENKQRLLERFATVLLDEEPGSGNGLLDHLGPGDWLGDVVYRRLFDMLDSLEICHGLRDGTVTFTPMDGASEFEYQGQDIRVEQRLAIDMSGVRIDVRGPWENTGQTNIHATEMGKVNMTPYQTFWRVEVSGPFTVVANATGPVLPIEVNSTKEGEVCMEILVPVFSGWSLAGVEYRPSSTLWGDAMDALNEVWQGILGVVDVVGRSIRALVDAALDRVASILSCGVQAVIWLAEVMEDVVASIQQACNEGLAWLMGAIASVVSDLLPQSQFHIDMFGLEFMVELDPMDLALRTTRDLLRVGVSIPMGNGALDLMVRFLRFGAGDYGIVANADMVMGEHTVSVIIDPLMRVGDHLVELNMEMDDTRVDILFPQVVQYRSFRVSLADMPGLGAVLSSIPLPWPGIKGSFDAGLEVKYNQPFTDHVVINEIEQNPFGMDAGCEWVELYNPSERGVDITGWTLQTSHGIQFVEPLGGVVPGRSRLVIGLDGQALDNGYGLKVPGGERLMLMDANGTRVDSTPWCTDLENDGRTWQRHYDGSDRWTFKDATQGLPNGRREASCSSFDWVRSTLVDSILAAAAEMGGLSPTVDSLARLLELTLRNLLRDVIDLIAGAIVEFQLFITAGVSDLTSASGGGLAFSLVVTSECIREALEWACDRMLELVVGLDDVTVARSGSHGLRFLAEDVYLRFAAYASVGAPHMLSAMSEDRLTLIGCVETNVAAVGAFLGQDWGRPCMTFSATLAQVPGWSIPRPFGVDADAVADVHLIRALVYRT